MVRSDAREPLLAGESLYAIVTKWASNAHPRLLVGVVILGASLVATLIRIDGDIWPLAALPVTLATICVWGLLEQYAPKPHARVVSALEWLLVIGGSIAAVAAALGVLFWVLGPAPNH